MEKIRKIPRILTIAGSDSGGGAGIQADLKTIAYHGCFGMSAITAVTAQNTQGVLSIEPMRAEIIQQQIQAVVNDIGIDAVKIGLLPSIEAIEVIAEEIKKFEPIPIVLDPVMVATNGSRLADETIMMGLVEKLFPLSLLVTPNLFEAQTLIGQSIRSDIDIENAGFRLLQFGTKNILIKGGHQNSQTANDCLISAENVLWFRQNFINSRNTHGTGCTLSSSIACFLAKGASLPDSVSDAKTFITECLSTFTEASLGHGYGAVFPTIHSPIYGGSL